jgi:hypothetical protein
MPALYDLAAFTAGKSREFEGRALIHQIKGMRDCILMPFINSY